MSKTEEKMKQKNSLSKVISIVLLFTLLFYIIYNLFTGEVNAAYSYNAWSNAQAKQRSIE